MGEFKRPIGPKADEQEILYIMSLFKNSEFFKARLEDKKEDINKKRKKEMVMSTSGYLQEGQEGQEDEVESISLDDRKEQASITAGMNTIPTTCLLEQHTSTSNNRNDQNAQVNITITAEDIQSYLLSRHGIKMSQEEVQSIILNGRKEVSVIGVLALLFIPTFCKLALSKSASQFAPVSVSVSSKSDEEGFLQPQAQDENNNSPDKLHLQDNNNHINDMFSPRNLIRHVLKMILHDVTGTEDLQQPLTEDLIRDILLKFYGAAPDDLVQEMFMDACSWDGHENNLVLDEDMFMDACSCDGRENNLVLDEDLFLKLLSSDLSEYSVDKEMQITTNFTDIFGKKHCFNGSTCPSNRDSIEEITSLVLRHERVDTGRGFDFFAGTYFCKLQMIFVLTFFFFNFMGFVYPFLLREIYQMIGTCPEFSFYSSWSERQKPFNCAILNSIIKWLLLLTAIIVTGFLTIYVASTGYDVDGSQEGKKLRVQRWISMIVICLLLFLPQIFIGFDTESDVIFFLQIIAMIFGSLSLLMRISLELESIFGCVTPGSSMDTFGKVVLHESQLKQATAFKLKRMQLNAMNVYTPIEKKSVIKAYYGQLLSNYGSREDETVICGSVSWGWKLFMSDDVYEKEGLWISARFLGVNFATVFISIFILYGGIHITNYVSKTFVTVDDLTNEVPTLLSWFFTSLADANIVRGATTTLMRIILNFLGKFLSILDDANMLRFDCIALNSYVLRSCKEASNATLSDFACNLFIDKDRICDLLDTFYRPQISFGNGTLAGLDSHKFVFNTTVLSERVLGTVAKAASDNLATKLNKFYPTEKYMVVIPCIIVVIVAFISSCVLTATVIPGVLRTSLMLRCSAIPTFQDPNTALNMHACMADVSYLPGVIFWGNLTASVLCGLFIGGIVFLCLWQVSVPIIAQLIALAIGACAAILMREAWTYIYRLRSYRGFFRKRPFCGNLFDLLNTCVNFGISILTVVSRLMKILGLAFLYVGRFDSEFLAEGVASISALDLDHFPKVVVADILAVEAHRHCYIETLGHMFLMKIKHRNAFISVKGTIWREIFVISLMPWLHKKYHVDQMSDLNLHKDEEMF